MSPSARKVWIEIIRVSVSKSVYGSPSARKVWIEISMATSTMTWAGSRLPQGRCGLKCVTPQSQKRYISVAFRKEGVD